MVRKMSKKIVAIGGGENGRILESGEKSLYETEAMDREIIRLTEKEKPNYLLIMQCLFQKKYKTVIMKQ